MRQLLALTPDNLIRNVIEAKSFNHWSKHQAYGSVPISTNSHQENIMDNNINRKSKCVSELRTYHGTYCKPLKNDQIMNYSNANHKSNINFKGNKDLDEISTALKLIWGKGLFDPAIIVEDTAPKQINEQ
ncbi:hypothetical protein TNCT_425801 [Trichonephila clavata]|uniref:Uncharacterized protein n=1 Tax=Trichonephila clavata TaxID=2740835 RepID=A0A8X6FTS1_TRICU|nr:hypothetical protein TNCT_425801 [Trichonephila clavata]